MTSTANRSVVAITQVRARAKRLTSSIKKSIAAGNGYFLTANRSMAGRDTRKASKFLYGAEDIAFRVGRRNRVTGSTIWTPVSVPARVGKKCKTEVFRT